MCKDIVNHGIYKFTIIGEDTPVYVWAKDEDEAKNKFKISEFIQETDLPVDYVESIKDNVISILVKLSITFYK